MSVATSDLRIFRAAANSNTPSANGGRASYNEAVGGVNNNVFPDVPQAERIAGSTTFRKIFIENRNTGNEPLYNSRIFLARQTAGEDAVYFHAGTQTNLQNALTGTEELYGTGKLDVSVIAGVTAVDVLIEDAATQYFADGDLIRISDKATIDGAGNEEFVRVNAAPTQAGSVVTLHFTPALANGYNAAASRVSKVMEYGDIGAAVSNVVVSTVGNGDYDNTAQPILAPNVGAVYDDWTVTFTSATAFGVVGAREGSVGTGSSLADFSPNNPGTSTPFFTIYAAGFSGAWAAGDTLSFRTTPAHAPVWMKRVVPAGATAYSGNSAVIAIDGESA